MNTVSNNLQFMELITLLLPWTILSLLIPFFLAADGREIGFGLGFLACFLLSPLIEIIIIIFSKDKTKILDIILILFKQIILKQMRFLNIKK